MPSRRGNPKREFGIHLACNEIEALLVGDLILQVEQIRRQTFVLAMQAISHVRLIGILLTDVRKTVSLVFVLEFVGQQIQQFIHDLQ